MSRHGTFLASSAVLLAVCSACDLEPRIPLQEHALNQGEIEKNADLAADEVAQAQLGGALELLFGTPRAPGYLRLQSWADEGYDPDPGSFGLTDEAYDSLLERNRFHHRGAIAAIEEGRFEEVPQPRYSEDLWESWLAHLEAMPEGGPDAVFADVDGEEVTWRDEAIYLFESYYPTLTTTAEMYRQQCKHCHGVSGGADGSTAPFLNPLPRDYRYGIFKFTALADKARPRREDLFRILTEGIYTTAMPSFRRFSDAQLHGLVDYVRLLSMRGETELLLIQDYDPFDGLGGLEHLLETYEFVHERWRQSEEHVLVYDGEVPAATPERIAHGRELFLGEEGRGANCASCHGVDGRGDGPSAFETDPETGELVRVKDDWGNEISPRDLTRGTFRFGRRPIDLYRRISVGINGTPMPEHRDMLITEEDGTQRPLDEEDVWDLVHFVRWLASGESSQTGAGASGGH